MAKTPDRVLAMLVKKLDKMVAAHQDQKLAAVVNILGEPTDRAKKKI
jgi:hypothetical protein